MLKTVTRVLVVVALVISLSLLQVSGAVYGSNYVTQGTHPKVSKVLANLSNPQSNPDKSGNDPPAVAELENEFVRIDINSAGTFTMQRSSDGKWLLFPDNGTTEFSVRIDNNTYWAAPWENGNLANYISTPVTKVDNNTAYIEYTTPEHVVIRHTFSLVGKSVKFFVEAKNNDSSAHSVKVRYLFDTQVDQNDGAPLYAEGVHDKTGSSICTYETDVTNVTFNEWRSYDQWPNPTLEGVGSLANIPYRIVFAYWPSAHTTDWDYQINPDQRFYTPGYTTSPESDSCVLMYFDLGTLSPYGSNSTTTYYGIGEPSNEELTTAVNRLKDALAQWEKYNVDRESKVFANAMDAVKRASECDMAQAVVDIVIFIFGQLAGEPAIQTSLFNYQRIENMVKFLKGMKLLDFALTIPSLGYETYDAFFTNYSQELFAKSQYDWIRENKDNLISKWTPQEIESNMNDFLWNKCEWSKSNAFGKGVKGMVQAIDTDLDNFVGNLSGKDLSNYPLSKVIEKIDSVTKEFQDAMIGPTVPVWNNNNYDTWPKEIGTSHSWESAVNKAIEDYRSSAIVSLGLSFAGLAIAGIGVFKVGSAIVTAGTTLLAESIALTGGSILLTIGSDLFDYFNKSPKEQQLGVIALQTMVDMESECNKGLVIVEELTNYLDYGNLNQLRHDATVDNSKITINNFSIDSVQIPHSENGIDYKDHIHLQVSNSASQSVPIVPYCVIYAKKSDGQIDMAQIAYPDGEVNLYPGFIGVSVPFGSIALIPSSDIGAESYIGYLHLTKGPALVSKEISTAVPFNITREGFLHSIWRSVFGGSSTIVQGEEKSATVTSSPDSVCSDFTLLYTGSDLDLHVYDENGNHVGVNYSTGQVEIQIPGATYSGSNVNPEWIHIPHSKGEHTYTVKVVANSTEGEESFQVLMEDQPERPAIMSISPSKVTTTADLSSSDTSKSSLVIYEIGGQKGINNLNASISKLQGNTTGYVIPPANISLKLDKTQISPSGQTVLSIVVNNLSKVPSDTYTGTITITGNQANNGPIVSNSAQFSLNVIGSPCTITTSAGFGGTITPSGTITVNYGGSQSFTIKADAGYFIYKILVDNTPIQFNNPMVYTYTFNNVTANHTISAEFMKIPDTTPPTVTLPTINGVNLDVPGAVITTNSGTFSFTVSAYDESGIGRMVVKVNGVVQIDKNNLDPTIYLSEGVNTVEVTVYDTAGNYTTKSFKVISDTKPPVIDVTLPETVSSQELTVKGTVVDLVTGVQSVTVNDNPVILTLEGNFETKLALSPGANTVIIEATDNVGNKSTKSFTVSYIQPQAKQSYIVILKVGDPNITVNGISQKIDAQGSKPIIKNGRTLLPIRTLIESLGGTVEWDAKEQKVTITLNGHSIVLWIGKTTALVDGSKTTLDVAPIIINGRTYLPLRFISEHLGGSVDWDPTTQTITIYYWP